MVECVQFCIELFRSHIVLGCAVGPRRSKLAADGASDYSCSEVKGPLLLFCVAANRVTFVRTIITWCFFDAG